MVATVAKPYTAEAYLALEVVSSTRNEYRNGEIVPMTGGTPAHNEISGSFFFLLKAALRKQPYSIFMTDQRLWLPDANIHTCVEHYIKQAENRWLFAEHFGLEASFVLSSVEMAIALADLYESIEFEAP